MTQTTPTQAVVGPAFESRGIAGIPVSRLVWVFAGLIVMSVLAFGIGFYRQFEIAHEASIERELANLATVMADDLKDDLRFAEEALAATAAKLKASAKGPTDTQPPVTRAWLSDELAGLRGLRDLAYLDANGHMLAHSDASVPAGESLAGRDYFIAQREATRTGGFIGAPIPATVSGQSSLPISYPVRDTRGQLRGVLTASVATERREAVWNALNLGAGGRLTLFHQNGQLGATYPAIAGQLGENHSTNLSFKTLSKRLADSDSKVYKMPTVLTGELAFIAARKVGDAPLMLLVSRPANEALAPLRAQGRFIASMSLALAIAALLFAAQLGRQLKSREAAEAELSASQAELLETQRVGKLGSWVADLVTQRLTLSRQTRELFELPDDTEFASPEAAVKALLHPDDLPAARAAIDEVLTGKVLQSERRVITASGRQRWVRTRTEATILNGRAVSLRGTLIDITDIKEAQLRLAESERRYRLLSENTRDLVSLHDRHGTLTFVSQSFQRITGHTPAELLERDFYAWVHSADALTLRAELDRQVRGGRVELEREFRFRHKEGHYLWLECLAASVHSATGEMIHIQASSRDVTERHRALVALTESEERFRRIIEFTSDWYWETDADYRFTKLTTGATKMPQIIPMLIGKRRWESPYANASETVWSAHRATIAARQPFKDLVLEFIDPETGKVLDYSSISGEPYFDEHGVFQGYRGTGRYITQQKHYEMDLALRTQQLGQVNAELKREASRRRELERRMLAAIEKELTQVGLELHDELGQNLTGVALMAKALHKKLHERGAPEAAEAARVHALVNSAIRQTRLISHGLSPHILGPEGLIEALQQLADDVTSLGLIECRFDARGTPSVADNLVARGLYRIAQEAVNNALKHSKAKLIQIELSGERNVTTLAVRDDGVGLLRANEQLGDSALHSIKYRAGVLGAQLVVGRRATGGTEVKVLLSAEQRDLPAATLMETE